MIGVVLALAAAACNAVATVLQRKATQLVPAEESLRLALMTDLIRRPVWLGGIAGLTGGFGFQAGALHFASLTLVQPIVVFELPLSVMLAAWVFRRRLDARAGWGTVTISAGVSMVLVALAPQPGHAPRPQAWLVAVAVTVAVGIGLVLSGRRARGSHRAALFGAAAGLGFGFTAALMNGALLVLDEGLPALLASWLPYATVAAGIGSVFLTQNALQAGPIVAAQPALTSCDPLASVAYGAIVFGETLRGGYWLTLAALGAVIAIAGTVLIARSPLIEASTRAGQ